MEKIKLTFTRKEKETKSVYWGMSGLEPASTLLPVFPTSTVPLSYTDTFHVSESLQN